MNDNDRQPEQKTMNYNNPMQPKICHLEIQLDITLHQKKTPSSKSPSTSPSTNTLANTSPTKRSQHNRIHSHTIVFFNLQWIHIFFIRIHRHPSGKSTTNQFRRAIELEQ